MHVSRRGGVEALSDPSTTHLPTFRLMSVSHYLLERNDMEIADIRRLSSIDPIVLGADLEGI